MSGEHYREAERLIGQAASWMDADYGWKARLDSGERIDRRMADLAEAQVHALLALVDALRGAAGPRRQTGEEA